MYKIRVQPVLPEPLGVMALASGPQKLCSTTLLSGKLYGLYMQYVFIFFFIYSTYAQYCAAVDKNHIVNDHCKP
jgi:hypothetical protein